MNRLEKNRLESKSKGINLKLWLIVTMVAFIIAFIVLIINLTIIANTLSEAL